MSSLILSTGHISRNVHFGSMLMRRRRRREEGGGSETVPGWGVTIHHMLPLSVRWKQYTCIALHVEVSGLLHSVLVRLKFSVRSTSATSWKSWYEALINSVLLRVIRSDSDLYVSDKQLNLNNFLWSSSEDKLRSLTAWGKEAGL